MNTTRDWEKPVRRLERLMRLKSFPVAFKLFEDSKLLSAVPFIRRMNTKSTLCQLINLVRNFDWTVGADLDDFIKLVTKYRDKEYIYIKTKDLIDREKVITLKQGLRYWPTRKVYRENGVWTSRGFIK